MEEKKKIGRPSTFTQEIADEICFRLSEGQSLRQICRDDDMPVMSTVLLWVLKNKIFSEQYRHAREIQADVMFDETIDIADDGSNDWMEIETKSGRVIEVANHEHINRSRLRVETRKWYISKVLPKKYGEKFVDASDDEVKEHELVFTAIPENGDGKKKFKRFLN